MTSCKMIPLIHPCCKEGPHLLFVCDLYSIIRRGINLKNIFLRVIWVHVEASGILHRIQEEDECWQFSTFPFLLFICCYRFFLKHTRKKSIFLSHLPWVPPGVSVFCRCIVSKKFYMNSLWWYDWLQMINMILM